MLGYSRALALIRRAAPAPRAERVPLAAALGRTLARPVVARADLPGFDNTAVDGYALRGPARAWFAVVGEAAAGTPWRGALRVGQAVRVLTGARVPRGTEAVVMQEHAERRGGSLLLRAPVAAGRNIRRRGEDLRRGATVLPAGAAVRPHELGLLAALGRADAAVWRRPRVAVLACGDELAEPGRRLRAGQIYESNAAMLAGLVAEAGAEPVRLPAARDRLGALVAAIRRGLAADVLTVCGGVSVGDRDLVRAAAARCGVRQVFWRVSIKPGMPLFFGRRGRTLMFGLPGNPVSVFVTFREFVRPVLDRLLGRPARDPYIVRAVLPAPLALSRARGTHFVRVRCRTRGGRLIATPVTGQGSHHLGSLVGADGWVRLPSRRAFAAGASVLVRPEARAAW